MTEMEIRKALEKMDVTTARGRAEANGRAISLAPKAKEIAEAASWRRDAYLNIVKEIRMIVENNRAGISDEELEMAEFMREMIIELAKKAENTTRDNTY